MQIAFFDRLVDGFADWLASVRETPTPLRKPKQRLREIGDGGEIRYGGGTTSRTVRNTLRGNVRVAYTLLQTPAQVARANRIQSELFGDE